MEDWSRFEFYARRVHFLVCGVELEPSHTAEGTYLAFLAENLPSAPFPNLRALGVHVSKRRDMGPKRMEIFFGPKLELLCIFSTEPEDEAATRTDAPVFPWSLASLRDVPHIRCHRHEVPLMACCICEPNRAQRELTR